MDALAGCKLLSGCLKCCGASSAKVKNFSDYRSVGNCLPEVMFFLDSWKLLQFSRIWISPTASETFCCNKDGHIYFRIFLLQCAWIKRLKHPNGSTISMSAILADSIPMAGRKLPCFPICQQLMLSASPRAPARLWPTWTVTAQSMLNHGANHPKYGWKMENMSQTTNQLTIAAFFRPRVDRKKNTPAI